MILEGPPSAGMIVIDGRARRHVPGGRSRWAKAYAEARQEHGRQRALLDEIAAAQARDGPHAGPTQPEELKEHGLQRLARRGGGARAARRRRRRLDDYRRFVTSLAQRVAGAKTEGKDQPVSEAESAAIAEISQALG